MSLKSSLRPVAVNYNGKQEKGYFHRFVYSFSKYHSETQVLIEHEDGRLRFYDPYFVRFLDRISSSSNEKEFPTKE